MAPFNKTEKQKTMTITTIKRWVKSNGRRRENSKRKMEHKINKVLNKLGLGFAKLSTSYYIGYIEVFSPATPGG